VPAQPAKPRPRRRLVLPPLTDGQQVLFTFDRDFPQDQRKPEAEKVLAARRSGASTRVVVPSGLHVHVRERADLPWQPIERPRRRGRPRMPPTEPPVGRGYEWSDDATATLGPQVMAIVGNCDDAVHDTDTRITDDDTLLDQLNALAAVFLERPLTATELTRLRTSFRGGPSRRRQDDGRDRRQAKASAITLELIGWKAGAGERDVKKYRKALRKGTRSAVEFLRYR
jgi:hypothetical protein